MNDQNHAANHDEDKIKRPGIAPVGTMKAARVVPVGPTIKRPGIAPVGTMIKRCFKDRKCGFKKKHYVWLCMHEMWFFVLKKVLFEIVVF